MTGLPRVCPSIANWTAVTPVSSKAVAATDVVPDTEKPAVGAVIVMVGGDESVVSVRVTGTSAGEPDVPAAVTVTEPGVESPRRQSLHERRDANVPGVGSGGRGGGEPGRGGAYRQLSVPPPEFEIPICFVTGNLVPATPFSARLAGVTVSTGGASLVLP